MVQSLLRYRGTGYRLVQRGYRQNEKPSFQVIKAASCRPNEAEVTGRIFLYVICSSSFFTLVKWSNWEWISQFFVCDLLGPDNNGRFVALATTRCYRWRRLFQSHSEVTLVSRCLEILFSTPPRGRFPFF
jgi:hypothetical protein